MKSFSFASMHSGYKYCILLMALIINFTKTTAQKIYSDDELLTKGTDYYNNNKYLQAEVYLFAYTQRNTNTYQSNNDFKSQIDQALAYCDTHSSLAGATAMFDLQYTIDANGNKHYKTTKLDAPKPVIINYATESIVQLRTGMYTCDDGGIYYITVINNEMWCYGTTYDNTRGNVIHGYISGDEIRATWADVPCCYSKNFGTVNLRIDDSEDFSIENQTGGFTGNVWKLAVQKDKKGNQSKKGSFKMDN
jgi:hypothetical protein